MPQRLFRGLTIAVLATAIGAAIALAVVCSASPQSRTPAYLHFTSDDASLTAELLPLHGDEPILPAFQVKNSAPLTVPPGSYRLRLTAPNHRSETLLVDAGTGASAPFQVELEDVALWPPIPMPRGGEVFAIDGRTDVIQHTATGMCRLHGVTAKMVWKVDSPQLELAGIRWRDFLSEKGETRPHLAKAAVDLDGDGTRDLVWLSRATPALFTQSGDDGHILWAYRGGVEGQVEGEPILFDRKGKPVFLVMFRDTRHCWLDAVTADKGARLWHADFGAVGDNGACFAVMASRRDGNAIVSIVVAGKLLELDALTGERLGEALPLVQPGQGAVVRCEFVDLSGKGVDDLLILRRNENSLQMLALSLRTRQTLWETSLQDSPDWSTEIDGPIVYQEADKSTTVLIHNGDTDTHYVLDALDGSTGQSRWRRRLPIASCPDGITNRRVRFLVGPDLDGDGRRDIFVATLGMPHQHGGRPHHYGFVDALSGKDGNTLWTTWQRYADSPGQEQQSCEIGTLSWGQIGGDGWPQLLVPLRPATEPYIYALSAGSGRVAFVLWGVERVQLADFDGDGIPDLYWFESSQEGRRLYTARGTLPEAWRRIGHWRPLGDLTSGNITEYVGAQCPQGVQSAISGRDGRLLFANRPESAPHVGAMPPVTLADLNFDGVPDQLTWAVADDGHWELRAIDGLDGKTLWRRRFSFDVNTRSLEKLPAVPLSYLGENGGLAVLVQDLVTEQGQTYVEVTALEPSNGEPRWRWRSAAGATLPNEQMPQMIELDAQKASVCFLIATGKTAGAIVLLDPSGNLRKQIPLENMTKARPWAVLRKSYPPAGLALVLVEGSEHINRLRILGSGGQLAWEWLPEEPVEIVDVAAAHSNGLSTLLVEMGGWHYGLSATDGKVEWRTRQRPTLVSTSKNDESAHLIYQTPTATVCLLADLNPAKETPRLDATPSTGLEWFSAIVTRAHLDWAALVVFAFALPVMLFARRWQLVVLVPVSLAAVYGELVWINLQRGAAERDPRLAAEQFGAGLGGQAFALTAAVLLAGLALWGVWRLLHRLGPRLATKLRPGRGW